MEKKEVKEHVGTLKRLQEKDPEFYEFLKEHDKELLEFNEEEFDDDDDNENEADGDGEEDRDDDDDDDVREALTDGEEDEPSRNVITSDMVDSWSDQIRDGAKLGAVRSLLRAFRSACHYGDDSGDDPSAKFSTMSSSVFNQIMLLTLTEMDGVFRGLLKLPPSGGKKEMITELTSTKRWKNYNHLIKSYLGNALHVLNQMTDNEMIAFTLKRLKDSSLFLAAFPALLRKFIKVALHFWGTGSGALPVVSFLFLRDSCIRLGSDCLNDCIRGMYKAYVLNCHFINSTKLQHIQFLSNCFTELLQVDISSAYQHSFTYIRQLAMILKEALSSPVKNQKSKNKGNKENSGSKKEKGKEALSNTKKRETFRKVYQWKYINCLELWTGVVCACSSDSDLRSLAYPLAQIITGVARLVPSACYFPLRLRCVRMLNRISASTSSFIPVSLLLMDMLEIKELRKPPTGGVGKAIDLFSILKVSKPTLKTRAFQEACVLSVAEELTEHLAQWSYSIGFMELSFIPCVRLRNFCKSTKVERFRREMKNLIRQIEANSDFINKKRTNTISFLPNDPAAESFLEEEKNLGISPLTKYAATLRLRAQERNDALEESSVLVGEHSSKFGKRRKTHDDDDEDSDEDDGYESEENASSLLPAHNKHQKSGKKTNFIPSDETAFDEDVIEDFVLSSDEDDDISMNDDALDEEEYSDSEKPAPKRQNKKQKQPQPKEHSRDKGKSQNKKSKKRKRGHGKSKISA